MRSAFRIVLRKNSLVVRLPVGEVESRLALDDGWFHIGPDAPSTYTLHFDAVAGSRALLVEYASGPSYRAFPP